MTCVVATVAVLDFKGELSWRIVLGAGPTVVALPWWLTILQSLSQMLPR